MCDDFDRAVCNAVSPVQDQGAVANLLQEPFTLFRFATTCLLPLCTSVLVQLACPPDHPRPGRAPLHTRPLSPSLPSLRRRLCTARTVLRDSCAYCPYSCPFDCRHVRRNARGAGWWSPAACSKAARLGWWRACHIMGKVVTITIKPRLQKDRWSLYWKESMETKTESLDDLQLSLSLTQTVAELQLLVSKQCKWEPIDSLERLEGFKEPWEHCVYKGNLLQPSSTLQECGIDGAAPVVAVRKSLFPEGWKILQDDEVDFSSSDDGF